MPNGTPYGVSDYGELEERLRLLFGLEGHVPVGLITGAEAVPVALIGDGTLPGSTFRRGRRWIAGFPATAAPAVALVFSNQETTLDGVIVDRLILSNTGNCRFQLGIRRQGTDAPNPGFIAQILDRNGQPIAGLGATAIAAPAASFIGLVDCFANGQAIIEGPFWLNLQDELVITGSAGSMAGFAFGRLP